MRIALFDYRVIPTNPLGGVHRILLEELSRKHDFTVFAVDFDNPCPARIRWVRVPVPRRPLALLFVAFHLMAPPVYVVHKLRTGVRFDVRHVVESNMAFGDVTHVQFCHRAYLRDQLRRPPARQLRLFLRWIDHALHAFVEPLTFRLVKTIVVPSEGIRTEVADVYPEAARKVRVIPNPVDAQRFAMPTGFDRPGMRRRLGLDDDAICLVFVALGHFERKGLPLLLDAVRALSDPRLHLIVVGGEPDLVHSYEIRCRQLGLEGSVHFLGLQGDVRPYFWAADVFVLPSSYEGMPFVMLEAAAAGLPMLVTRISGVEDFVVDGRNGLLIERSTDDIVKGVKTLLGMDPDELEGLKRRARATAMEYSVPKFVVAWEAEYSRVGASPEAV